MARRTNKRPSKVTPTTEMACKVILLFLAFWVTVGLVAPISQAGAAAMAYGVGIIGRNPSVTPEGATAAVLLRGVVFNHIPCYKGSNHRNSSMSASLTGIGSKDNYRSGFVSLGFLCLSGVITVLSMTTCLGLKPVQLLQQSTTSLCKSFITHVVATTLLPTFGYFVKTTLGHAIKRANVKVCSCSLAGLLLTKALLGKVAGCMSWVASSVAWVLYQVVWLGPQAAFKAMWRYTCTATSCFWGHASAVSIIVIDQLSGDANRPRENCIRTGSSSAHNTTPSARADKTTLAKAPLNTFMDAVTAVYQLLIHAPKPDRQKAMATDWHEEVKKFGVVSSGCIIQPFFFFLIRSVLHNWMPYEVIGNLSLQINEMLTSLNMDSSFISDVQYGCSLMVGMIRMHRYVYKKAYGRCALYRLLYSNADIAKFGRAIAAERYLANAEVVHARLLAQLPQKYRNMTAVEVVKNFFLSEVPSEVTTVVNEWVNKLLGEALHYENPHKQQLGGLACNLGHDKASHAKHAQEFAHDPPVASAVPPAVPSASPLRPSADTSFLSSVPKSHTRTKKSKSARKAARQQKAHQAALS